MRIRLCVAALWIFSSLGRVGTADAQTFTLIDLGTLGGPSSSASAISSNGIVVGSSVIAGANIENAFKWENGVMTSLGTFGSFGSEAYGVNASGEIVGITYDEGDPLQAFIYKGGRVIRPYPSTNFSAAYAINDNGQVVGSFENDASELHPFVYSAGTLTTVNVLGEGLQVNAAGDIVGDEQSGDAFLFADGATTDLGIGTAQAINDREQITGEGDFSCFLTTNGKRIKIGQFRKHSGTCIASSINNSGTVVGRATLPEIQFVVHAFIYRDGNFTDLNSHLAGPLASYVILTSADGINDSGQIAATGNYNYPPYETHAFLLNPVLPLSITCPASTAQVGSAYASKAVTTGGVPPYSYTVISGMLPNGLDYSSNTGIIVGTPIAAGNFNFDLQVTDTSPTPEVATQTCSITVTPVAGTAKITVTPSSLSFGHVDHYSSQIKEIMVRNTGTISIRLASASVSAGAGTNAHVFTVIDKCGEMLASGASCSIYVMFVAEQDGALSATLTVPSSAGREPAAIALSAVVTNVHLVNARSP